MLLVSIKHLGICKYYVYFALLPAIVEIFLPKSSNLGHSIGYNIIYQIVEFITLYFDFWPSLIVSLVSLVFRSLHLVIFQDFKMDASFIIILLVAMLILSLILWLMHIIIT